MQWRRGLAFAAVHLAVALPILASLEANDTIMIREMDSHHAFAADKPRITHVSWTQAQAGTESDFDVCGMIDEIPWKERILVIADLPAMFLTAWRMPCPPRWSISGLLLGKTRQLATPARLAKQRDVDGILLLLIAIQWLLIGGFPLRPYESLKHDPATLITICAVAAGAVSLIPQIALFSGLFTLIAFFFWLYWLALLAWKLIRSTRSRILGTQTQPGT